MTAHKHADVIRQFADIAARCEHPETWVEYRHRDRQAWIRLDRYDDPYFDREMQYRITDPDANIISAPSTPFDGLEGPMRDMPKGDRPFWVLLQSNWPADAILDDRQVKAWLSQGRIFRTEAARDAWEQAHIKFTMGESK